MSDFKEELAKLHTLRGADFSRQAYLIANRGEFYPLKGEQGIYVVGGVTDSDYTNLLNAARKVVLHGYRVFVLPNPLGIRTADFIFERKGIYRVYDLKTIHGKASVINRLRESVGQSNRIILNMKGQYDGRALALDIKTYFEQSPEALEVIVLKSKKLITVNRNQTLNKMFPKRFRRMYEM